jgi:class 3 adenylate cyclase/tetratricopeptide (TPR) repeat protein
VLICPSCGCENPDGFLHCGFCTASLTAPTPGRRRLATLVFCDLVGSTALAERVDAESLQELLSRYFGEMRAALERHGGTVEKFIGDAVVGVFGVPLANEDDALRACRAALEMQKRLALLNPELERLFATRIEVRIGVNSGEVVGSRETFVAGDAANVAARMEQAAAAGEVLLGETTYRLVREAVLVERVEPVEAKGKAEPLAAYRLLAAAGPGPLLRQTATPFIGRESELALLEREIEAAIAERRCRLVTVAGEPGVGKSRLAGELIARIGTRGRSVLGACLSYGEGITYWPIGQIVRDLTGIRDDHTPEQARAQIATLLAGAPDEAAVAAQIAQLLGLGEGATTPEELAWAVRRLLTAAAGERPLLVLVEDIHWAEPALLELLAGLPAALTGVPILVVCLARPELHERRPDWPVEVVLEPLGEADANVLLVRLGAPEDVRSRLAKVAGGNPLFAEELVGMLIDEGVLRRDGDATSVVGELNRIELPTSLNALLGARLDRLDGETRRALERGAVEGELFHQAAIVELTDEASRSSVPGELGELARKDLIRLAAATLLAGEIAYRFKHILVREAAYLATAKKLRATLHQRYADWLEQLVGERVSEYHEILGYHLEQSYRYRIELGSTDEDTLAVGERAVRHLTAAARRARDRADFQAVASLFERALAIGVRDSRERTRVQVELGVALNQTGQVEESERILREAGAAAAVLRARDLAAHALLELHTTRMHLDEESPGWLDGVIETFTEFGDDRGLARALPQRAAGLTRAGRTAEAIVELDRALAHAATCGDRELRRRAIAALCDTLNSGPTPVDSATASVKELLSSAGDDRVLGAEVKRALAGLYAMAGRSEEALELFRESGKVLEELGHLQSWTARGMFAADVAALAGYQVVAEEARRAAIAYFRDLRPGVVDGRAWSMSANLASSCCDEGRWVEADDLLTYGREVEIATMPLSQATRLAVEARLAARRGELDQAVALAERAVASPATRDWLNHRARHLLALAEVLRAAGRTVEGDAALAKAIELYEQKGNVAGAARVRALAVSA